MTSFGGRTTSVLLAGVALAAVAHARAVPEVAGATTVTEYEYNADGALVRVTRTEAGSESAETYLVWDNYTPGTGDPTQGTLASGNGNLLGTGPSPTSLESTYVYDLRNRLVEQEGPGPEVRYVYDAASLLGAATSGGETYRFVYDESANARVTNIEAETADVVLRRMGPVCSLTDGTERMLVRPDKDVAGVYDTSAETFTAYEYDPYGGTEESGGTKLDLHENPFQYAGEYRDPIWGGYYLRARWYAPELPTFLTRDPAPNLSRYGYGDGNPRNRVDPSGRSSKWWKRWNKGGAKFMQEVTGGGARGIAERILFGDVLMPMGIVANPKAFWESVARGSAATTVVNDAVLAVGMIGEVVMDGPISGTSGYGGGFLRRVAFDAAFGLAQSAASASSHGFRRFNEKAFFQGLEFTAGGTLDTRLVAGVGFRPFDRSIEEVARIQRALGRDDIAVFRGHTPFILIKAEEDSFLRRYGLTYASQPHPVSYLKNLSQAHDFIAFVANDRIAVSEIDRATPRGLVTLDRDADLSARPERTRYQYVGTIRRGEVVGVSNPLELGVKAAVGSDESSMNLVVGELKYNRLRLNCQDHASAVAGAVRALRRGVR